MNKSNNTENAGAHSTTRAGESDYTDGEDVTHYLGNGDYKNGNRLEKNPYSNDVHEEEVGKVAQGNNLTEHE